MGTATARRPFDPKRDARRHVILVDPVLGGLYEVIGVRGMTPGHRPEKNAAAKLLDCRDEIPTDPFVELDRAPWVPLAEFDHFEVVERRS